MLGISIYFQDYNEDYLRMAAKCNAKYIMTSLQIPEEDYSCLDEQLPSFLDLIKELNMELIPDVSEETFKKLNLNHGDFKSLKHKGFNKIRLDYGFDDIETLKTLLEDFDIVINASVIDESLLIDLKKANIDLSRIMAMHNYYPRKDTGLKEHEFKEKNKLLHRYGVKVQAFVSGDEIKRFPLYEGLPTLEKHRYVHPFVATVDLLQNYDVDDVFIGDSQASISTLNMIDNYINNKTILLPSYINEDYREYYHKALRCRKELSPHVVRMTTPRIKGIKPRCNGYRRKGFITIDNELMGRYCGEVQIMKEDMNGDSRCNIIGFIHPDLIELLDLIDNSFEIKFVEFEHNT